jgi:hypothetical protein
MPKRKEDLPDWAAKERAGDMAWLAENLHVLWPAAQTAYEQMGRGAVTIDTTWHPEGMGNPMWYLPQEQLAPLNDPDVLRMVAEYDPRWEFVASLLKQLDRTSTYRVGVPGAKPED